MAESINEILQVLKNGKKEQKIFLLEKLENITEPEILNGVIDRLNDEDIEVRGESFSTLVSNQNKISKFLIKKLSSESKNIRGYLALVLANRKDEDSIPYIIKLLDDQSSMVKSCALGALGFLRAKKAIKVIHGCFNDSNLEVKKSAIKAAIDIGNIPNKELKKIKIEDEELKWLILLASKNNQVLSNN